MKAPLLGGDEEGDDVDVPWAGWRQARVAVDVVGDTVLADAAGGAGPAVAEFLRADLAQGLHQAGPSGGGARRRRAEDSSIGMAP